MSKVKDSQPETAAPNLQERLDKEIGEAAAQIINHDLIDDFPHRRFVLLCAARAEFENEALVGFDPELQWVEIAKDAHFEAARSRKKECLTFPHLLSDAPSAVEWQREMYQNTMRNLVITNTGQSPEDHWGPDFVGQVASGDVQIRYV